LLLGLAIVTCVFVVGCKRERAQRLSPAQVHQITQELANAMQAASPSGTVIKVRRAKNESSPAIADDLYVRIHGNAGASGKLLESIESVATQHRLTVDALGENGNVKRITLRSLGGTTHRIEIELLAPLPEITGGAQSGQPKLAILLDDLGSDRAVADEIFALGVPITISVLPFHAHSREIADEAAKHGSEVMLHLPMQSLANETQEQEELKPGLSEEQVEKIVARMLEAVPHANGVNNHQGSEATANGTLMDALMPVLKDAGVFYVDSRTTAATVAFETAKRDGVKTAFRNVPFLDDVRTKAAVEKQLMLAIRGAKEKGEAIAIGHPHAETLLALRQMLPEMKKQRVRLVFVSELVH